jgi:hypothetical protein
VKRIVGPAFWIVAAAGQWGPEYAAWDDGRVWDVLIRLVLSMAFACMAVKGIRANMVLTNTEANH